MKKLFDTVAKALTLVSLVLLVVYAVLVAIQVISRYVFNSPTTWTELVARYMFVWSVMLYAPVLYRNHGDSRFDMIFNKQKPKVQKNITLIIDLIVLFSAFFMLFWGIRFCNLSGKKLMVGLSKGVKVKMNWAYASIPTGGAFLLMMSVEQIISRFHKEART